MRSPTKRTLSPKSRRLREQCFRLFDFGEERLSGLLTDALKGEQVGLGVPRFDLGSLPICPPMAQNQTRNTHIVSRARKIWLCAQCLRDSIRLFGDRFARCLLKSVDRYDVGVSSEAHSGHASLCERTYVCALADHDIDRQG